MLHTEALELFLGAVALGAVHGVEPGHGWPVAASYALDQANKWVYGFAASFILGVGHLVSSIAMVLGFFYAKSYFNLTQVDEPIHLVGDVFIGGPVSVVAGLLLIALGIREYRHGHSHGGPNDEGAHHTPHDHAHVHADDHANHHAHVHANDHAHVHADDHANDHADDHADDHAHDEDHSHTPGGDQLQNHDQVHEYGHAHREHDDGLLTQLKRHLPFGGGHAHSPAQLDEAANRSLLGIAWFAFLLGFAHEEEFEIIALCAGSVYCLELMVAYASTVIVGIVGLTMVLIAGYEHYENRVERYTPYLPAFSAAVLIIMGVGFVTGLF